MQTNPRTDYNKVANQISTKIENFFIQAANSHQNARPGKLLININEMMIVIEGLMQITSKQNNLLNIEAPIKVVGDIQGHLSELLRILQYGGQPPMEKYLFLGNYIEGGKYSLFTILYLYCLKIRFPKNIYLLRGNNESTETVMYSNFQNQCIQLAARQVFQSLCHSFITLPLAAVVSGKIFCVHGGLSPEINQPNQINGVCRFQSELSGKSILRDLLWSDPMQTISGWIHNDFRNISYCYGADVVAEFLSKNNLQLMIRSHEFKQNGYGINSLSNLITIFSASNYLETHQNSGAFVSISASLECSIYLLKPILKGQKVQHKN